MCGIKKRRFAALILTVLLALSAVYPSLAYAEGHGGQRASISSDAASYKSGDTIALTIASTNDEDATWHSVSYSVKLPDGVEVDDGSALEGSFGDIAPGETKTATIKARALASKTKGSIPQTGDSQFVAWIPVFLMGLLLAAAGVRNRRNAALMILAAAVLAVSTYAAPVSAHADQGVMQETSTCEFKVNGKTVRAQVTVRRSRVSATDPVVKPDPVQPATISRGAWLSKLLTATNAKMDVSADAPFLDIAGNENEAAIKAAYSLGIIDGGQKFNPDAPATREFVFATAVLRAGFSDDGSKLKAADANEANKPALLQVALDEGIASLDEQGCIRPQAAFDATEADGLAKKVADLMALGDSSSEDCNEVVYRKDVVVIHGFERVGDAYKVSSDCAVAKGDKVALETDESQADGAFGVVRSCTKNGDGTLLEIAQANKLEDYFESIDISKSKIAASLDMIEPLEGVELVDEPMTTAVGDGKFDLPTVSFKIGEQTLGKYGKGELKLKMSPYARASMKWSADKGFQEMKLGLGGTAGLEGELKAELKRERAFPVARIPFKISPTLTVWSVVNVEVSVYGKVKVTLDVESESGVFVKNGHVRSYHDATLGDSKIACEAGAKLGVGPQATLNFLSMEVCDVKLAVGAQAKGTGVVRDTGMVCNDVAVFAYADLTAGKDTVWMDAAGLTLEVKFWDEDNSPFKKNFHLEDFAFVPECTYGKENYEDGWVYDLKAYEEKGEIVLIAYDGPKENPVVPAKVKGKYVKEVNYNIDFHYGKECDDEHPMLKAKDPKSISFEKGSKVESVQINNFEDDKHMSLESIDVSNCPNLRYLGLLDTNVAELNLKGNPRLSEIWLNTNLNLKGLDVSHNNELTDISINCSGRGETYGCFSQLILGSQPQLRSLCCVGSNITSLDLSKCPSLKYVELDFNMIKDTSSITSHPNYDPDRWNLGNQRV